jgi:hypothetical protein
VCVYFHVCLYIHAHMYIHIHIYIYIAPLPGGGRGGGRRRRLSRNGGVAARDCVVCCHEPCLLPGYELYFTLYYLQKSWLALVYSLCCCRLSRLSRLIVIRGS